MNKLSNYLDFCKLFVSTNTKMSCIYNFIGHKNRFKSEAFDITILGSDPVAIRRILRGLLDGLVI